MTPVVRRPFRFRPTSPHQNLEAPGSSQDSDEENSPCARCAFGERDRDPRAIRRRANHFSPGSFAAGSFGPTRRTQGHDYLTAELLTGWAYEPEPEPEPDFFTIAVSIAMIRRAAATTAA